MTSQIDSAETQKGELADLRLLIRRLWARRVVIGLATVAGALILGAIGYLLPPSYRVSVVMVSAMSERNSLSGSMSSALGQLGTLASLAGVNVGGNDLATEEALAVLRSRTFIERFVTQRNLLPKLFASRWDENAARWRGEPSRAPTPAKGARYFDKNVRRIEQNNKTGLVTLYIEWKNPSEAAEWANDLVDRLNAEMRARAIQSASDSVSYLEKELTSTSVVETRDAINRLIETQVKQRMLATVTKEFAFRVVDRATPPEKDDKANPGVLLMLALGAVGGAGVAIAVLLLANALGLLSDPTQVSGEST